jgi:hypothetical protein
MLEFCAVQFSRLRNIILIPFYVAAGYFAPRSVQAEQGSEVVQ